MRWLTEVMWPAEAQLTGPDVRAGMLLARSSCFAPESPPLSRCTSTPTM